MTEHQNSKHLYSVFLSEDYEITPDANLYSYKTGTRRKLTPTKSSNGYIVYIIKTPHSTTKKQFQHRLIATAYHGLPPTPQHVARHLDGNKSNNHYTNIAWGTQKQNGEDEIRNNNTTNRSIAAKNRWASLTPEERHKLTSFASHHRTHALTPEQRSNIGKQGGAKSAENWAQKTPEQRAQINQQRAAKIAAAAAQKRQLNLKQINQGRTRPYLDNGGPHGPQIDLFNDKENTNN